VPEQTAIAPRQIGFASRIFPTLEREPGQPSARRAAGASPPFAINGVLEKKGEAAFFRFSAKKDQNLDFQVFARRLGSPMDSVLTCYDAKGASLGSNDDASGIRTARRA
jgi:hypothetical protein